MLATKLFVRSWPKMHLTTGKYVQLQTSTDAGDDISDGEPSVDVHATQFGYAPQFDPILQPSIPLPSIVLGWTEWQLNSSKYFNRFGKLLQISATLGCLVL